MKYTQLQVMERKTALHNRMKDLEQEHFFMVMQRAELELLINGGFNDEEEAKKNLEAVSEMIRAVETRINAVVSLCDALEKEQKK